MANLAPMQRALKVVSFHRKRLSNESIGIIRESWTRFTTQFTSKVHPGPPRTMEPAGLAVNLKTLHSAGDVRRGSTRKFFTFSRKIFRGGPSGRTRGEGFEIQVLSV